jgi:RimJ/RimL family protein N-acetyltransferase
MTAFPIDRTHPPSRVVHDDGATFLELRPWAPADVDALMAAVAESAPELRGFMPWAHLPMTRAGQYELVARFSADYHAGREYILGMFSRAGAPLGGVGLHPRVALNPRGLEIGYWTHSGHAGRGLATLASRMLAVVAFDAFACDRLQVMHDEANVASRRVVEKCGFAYEGTLRNAVAEVAPEIRAGGYAGTGRHRLYALAPEDLPRLEWLARTRAAITFHDALGRRASPGP